MRSRHISASARARPGTGSSDSISRSVSIPPTWAKTRPVAEALGSANNDNATRAIRSPCVCSANVAMIGVLSLPGHRRGTHPPVDNGFPLPEHGRKLGDEAGLSAARVLRDGPFEGTRFIAASTTEDRGAMTRKERPAMLRTSVALSARGHGVLRSAPTNLLPNAIRTRRALKWGISTMLLAVPCFYVAAICTTIVNECGPGWLHLLVLLLVWFP